MELEHLLKEYGQKKQISGLKLDRDNICRLMVNKEFVLWFELFQDGNGFYLFTKIGTLPHTQTLHILQRMLEANLYASEVLSLDQSSDSIVLFKTFQHCTTDYDTFEKGIESFINKTEEWRQKIKDPKKLVAKPEGEGAMARPWLRI